MAKSEVSIREYDRERDMEAIEKLERSCEIGAGKGFSIVTNMMGDPLCRIRLFQLHVMMVAELTGGGGELVGVARGCVKRVATGVGDTVLAGYVLGLRVSPVHRRKGIGLKLVESVEAWAARHGACHVVAAADAANAASRGLFVGRRGYATAARLSILVQPLADVRPPPAAASSRSDVRIERLAVEQAAMLYKRRFGGEPLCPSDVDAVLGAAPSLGTWMARFAGGGGGDGGDGAWACVSLWNTCASYRLQVVAPPPRPAGGGRALLARLAAVAPTPPCMGGAGAGAAPRGATCGEFGFVLAYGIDGEGGAPAVRALVRALWTLAAGVARRVGAECKALVVEAAAGDPVARHVPRGRLASRVDDVWLVKPGGGAAALPAGAARRRFVDPRDF
uniref:N-acetyltransferase domain-containing protein n=1 Tax=Oryza nivara TaxID=4536 RepID=A0A0E0JB77_ORYNI